MDCSGAQIYIYQFDNLIKLIVYMQVFRKKYIFNPENPIFESDNVQTYNCMNTETKDNKLIIIRHIAEPPFVEPAPGVLQPLEHPSITEPFSIYPLVYCCSEIGRMNETDAMYVIKCLLDSKVKDPLYCVMSPQGIVVSSVEGLLPNRSPSLFEIATDLLGMPASLTEEDDSVLSKDAYTICRGIRDGESVTGLVSSYGWNNPKKEKDTQKDDQFWIFKGKKKEESPFGEDYSLAWLSKYGMVKFKYIDLSKDGYEDEFLNEYLKKIDFYRNNEEKKVNTVEIFKFTRDSRGIKIFLELLNMGNLNDYLNRRSALGKPLTQKTAIPLLDSFVNTMCNLADVESIRSHGSLHSKMLYVHNHRLVLGEPLLVTDKIEKKLRELKTLFDFYAPQMKENIILPENLFKLSFQKMDIWAFGFLLHKVITRDLPSFDPNRRPILNSRYFSPGMLDLITRCLSIAPALRPDWFDINLRDLQAGLVVQVEEQPPEKEIIRLGTSKQASQKSQSKKAHRYEQIRQQQEVINVSEKAQLAVKQEVQEQEVVNPIPIELSLRLKRIKLIVKIIIIMLLYIFVFFRDFLGSSIGVLLVRSYYGTTSLNLVDNSGTTLSTTVIITNQPNYFLLNDISFSDIQNVYSCINNQFDPIYNPNYSLLSYVQSPSFLALLLTGWMVIGIICVTKAISIWKGGISNRPTKNLGRYLVVYAFHQLSLASLLYAHFFIYQFFYFASATPCFSLKAFAGIEPYFDSSLYLFLSNQSGYLAQVFSSLGVLAILVCLSSCYYAWGPKLDQKYFLSVPSILFRIIPYILLILICRIGVFALFSPSAVNDTSKVLPALISGSSNGFFGIIPQVFVMICVVVEILLELFFYWCERKAADSDKLSRLFNVKKKKISTLQESNAHLNDMSLVKSHSKVANDELFN